MNHHNKTRKHPVYKDKTISEVFAQEKDNLVSAPVLFDGYKEISARVSKTCLVCYDRNNYSVNSKCAGKIVECRAYSDRLVFIYNGQEVGKHKRLFSKGKTSYDVNHYLPLLTYKPGSLRNGEPFINMELPEELRQVELYLTDRGNKGKDFATILSYIPSEGMETVTEACRKAIKENTISKDIIVNIILRQKEEPELSINTDIIYVALQHEVKADCGVYNNLLKLR